MPICKNFEQQYNVSEHLVKQDKQEDEIKQQDKKWYEPCELFKHLLSYAISLTIVLYLYNILEKHFTKH